MKREEGATRVGQHIRRHVIPPGMTVTEAAKRLEVSRVALSNLLNGSAELSQRMALRLQAVFGADPDEMFKVQHEGERVLRRDEEKAIALRPYLPAFLTIKAAQIDAWAEQDEEARNRLPVLVRRLIHSTGRDLHGVDFPGYGDVGRSGWDGKVKAGAAISWIPAGVSGWEVSTRKDTKRKADEDFRKRLAFPEAERAETTFVFVSSRNWDEKDEWAKKKRAEGHWKDVWAFDASDLEQWLEASAEGQIWLMEQLGLPSVDDCMTLDRAWKRWAEVTEPSMPEELFRPAVGRHLPGLAKWLRAAGPERPLRLAADSKGEALAFLACLSRHEEAPAGFRDRAVVIDSVRTLRTLTSARSSFIPVVGGDLLERELAHWWHHGIVVRPRNAVGGEPDIELGPLGHETFRESLAKEGFARARIDRLARESGRSPTILRRRLARNDATKRPRWAKNDELARKLIPMVLVGAWHADSKADREVLSTLAARPFSDIEEDVADLLGSNDSPVWSAGRYSGIVSKIDALFAVGRCITPASLDDFLVLSEYVLSEADPAWELAPDQRWAAGLYGKLRDHSEVLRTGVCETLVLLAVHGSDLLQKNLGIDVEAKVSTLVGRLLAPDGADSPLTVETLMSYDRDLPRLAEAAPDELLRLLEVDLRRNDSALFELLKPADVSVFAGCPRTGLLWALECLAWNQCYLPRVVLILGRLSETPIDDNWVNKPINSLEAIFRSWMPQTAVPLGDRSRALELLCERVPEVGWQVCMEQLRLGSRSGDFSERPRWRGDAGDAGEPVLVGERMEFEHRTLELVLEWPHPRDAEKLGDLIDLLSRMSEEDQRRVWVLVEGWLEGQPGNPQRAALRERLRQFGYKSSRPALEVDPALKERVKALYDRLAPKDPARRHAWLFSEHWIHEWPEDDDDAMDFSGREERVAERRAEAMTEIWSSDGLKGALSLLPSSNAPDTVGVYASRCAARSGWAENLRTCVAGDLPNELGLEEARVDGFLRGFVREVDEDMRDALLSALAEEFTPNEAVRLLLNAPFAQPTWRVVGKQAEEVRLRYWQEVTPRRVGRYTEAEVTELIDRLLEAERPRAAFAILYLEVEKVETLRLKNLLWGLVVEASRPDASVPTDAYQICRAVESLGRSRVRVLRTVEARQSRRAPP